MTTDFNTSRRKLILAGIAAGALGATALLRPGTKGVNHTNYYQTMSSALNRAGISGPTMVIDKAILLRNIEKLKKDVSLRYDYRIVGKSLPSLPLIKLVMEKADTNKVMMFHQPFLNQLVRELPESDVLLGKPMPVAAVAKFYTLHKPDGKFNSERQLQWLIDTPERLQQYGQLAAQLNTSMRINIELDVGLHRGGVQTNAELIDILKIIDRDPLLTFSGFMGYEPHVAKMPTGQESARDKAMGLYEERVKLAKRFFRNDLNGLTLNAAGSPTYKLYTGGDFPPNELAAGSCLVKPVDFDLPTLTAHAPAAFIATPILKALDKTEIAGAPGLGKLMALWNPNRAKAFFSYGGYWKAKPASPEGLTLNPVFGRSTNQEMYNGSRNINLKADDWMFLRPTQSEFVFLQFGDIAVYHNGEIVDMWPTFNANA